MADQWGGQSSDQRRPNVDIRFLSPAGTEAENGSGGGQPVAGRRATPGGSRLVGRATLARLRGVTPAARRPAFLDEPTAPQPIVTPPKGTGPGRPAPPSDAGRVVLVYEQQIRKPWRLWVFTAMLVSLTIGVVLGQTEAYRAGKTRSVAAVPDVSQPAVVSPAPLTTPLGAVRERRLEITGPATLLRIRTAQMGESLFTITGTDPAAAPQITEAGGGSVLAVPPGTGAEVILNSAVAWTVKLTGGTGELDMDARAGGLVGVESTAEMSRVLLQLAKPKGAVPLKIAGPVGDLTVRTEAGALVRVRAGKGAAVATIGGKTRRDVKAGATLQETGWRAAPGRYDIRVNTRVNTLLVERLPQAK